MEVVISDKIRLVFRPRVDQLRIVQINMPDILAMIEDLIAQGLSKCGRCGKPAYEKDGRTFALCVECINEDINRLIYGDWDED